MCDYIDATGGREAAMVVIERDPYGRPTVWCDPCLAPLVKALNDAGIRTIASCCGHGKNDPSVGLEDGTWLVQNNEPPTAYEFRDQADLDRIRAEAQVEALKDLATAHYLDGPKSTYETIMHRAARIAHEAGIETGEEQ